MALLSILRYPDPRLHTIAKPVSSFDERLAKLVADMADTMYTAVYMVSAISATSFASRSSNELTGLAIVCKRGSGYRRMDNSAIQLLRNSR